MKVPSWKRNVSAASVCFAAVLGSAQLPAHTVEVSATAAQVASAPLLLNGSGVRHGAMTGLYSAALYLEHTTANAADVLKNTGNTQFRMVMLRDTTSAQLADLLTEGLVANASEDDLVTLVSEIFDLGVMLSEQGTMTAGDSFQIDSHPAAGTTLTIRSSSRSEPISQTFANPRLFKVMMGIWLGEHPADLGLKSALLGKTI